MTWPLVILAVFAALLGIVGTPFWPAFSGYLSGEHPHSEFGTGTLILMLVSTLVVVVGIAAGWRIYGSKPARTASEIDPIEASQPGLFAWLRDKFYIDELYEKTIIRFNACAACGSDWLDRVWWSGVVNRLTDLTKGLAFFSAIYDQYLINDGFDESCKGVRKSGGFFSRMQDGQTQTYLRVLGVALTALVLLLTWGCGK
jgi:NADH-quinone oxidoreductase subunit L